jgi:hypothetical protein
VSSCTWSLRLGFESYPKPFHSCYSLVRRVTVLRPTVTQAMHGDPGQAIATLTTQQKTHIY